MALQEFMTVHNNARISIHWALGWKQIYDTDTWDICECRSLCGPLLAIECHTNVHVAYHTAEQGGIHYTSKCYRLRHVMTAALCGTHLAAGETQESTKGEITMAGEALGAIIPVGPSKRHQNCPEPGSLRVDRVICVPPDAGPNVGNRLWNCQRSVESECKSMIAHTYIGAHLKFIIVLERRQRIYLSS